MAYRRLVLTLSLLLLSAVAFSCNNKGSKGSATPTPSSQATLPAVPTNTAAPSGSPTPAPDIREQDFAQVTEVKDFLVSGGAVDKDTMIYADLTEDGVEDAVVPISTGGEGGDRALFVFAYGPDGLTEVLRATATTSLKASVVSGRLQVDEAQFATGDPMCCPSQIQRTTYAWDGEQLIFDTQETVPASG